MYVYFLVAVGGALGALARFGLANALGPYASSFPYPTIIANLLGSFVMGILFVMIVEKMLISSEWRYFLMVGLLGAFTTFSTFSVEVLNLIKLQSIQSAGVYLILSVCGSILAALLGITLAQKIVT